MTTPVSFEIAKLLIQKEYNLHIDFKDSYPTIAEVVMWLYEKHGIWISVTTQVTSEFQMVFTAFRPSIKLVFHSDPSKPYNSPTEAYEAAIEYYLIDLI